jgi:molybdopterin molybdotransferase
MFSELMPAVEARRRLAEAAQAVGTERVPLAGALGRVLAADVVAPEDLPRFARSAVDGYAVHATDLAGARPGTPALLLLGPAVVMGEAALAPLSSGQAVAVATGARVPPGTDAVVMVERTVLLPGDAGAARPEQLQVLEALAAGRNLVAQGEDVRVGTTLVGQGRRIAPRDLALLAAVGISDLLVTRRPRVAVLSSGAELVPAAAQPGAGGVRDVNLPALAAAAGAAGALVTSAGIVPDDPAVVSRTVGTLAEAHDLVLITGGTSVGAADHTAEALHLLGARTLFHGVAIRPGRPTLAAQLGDTLIIGLPGVPAAAQVVFEVFVRAVLARLGGVAQPDPALQRARLRTALGSAVGREDYVRVRLDSDGDSEPTAHHARTAGGDLWATPLPGSASSLFALAAADGVAIVAAEVASLEAGDQVPVLLFG